MAILIFPSNKMMSLSHRYFRAICLAILTLVFAAIPAQAQRVVSATERTEAQALLQQAYASYESGDYPQAHILIDKAEKLQPDQPDGWNLRGAVFLKEGIYDKAGAAFARAVALDPKLWAAQFNLGEVAFRQKDYRRARARFEELLDQTDRYKEANRWELAAYKAYITSLLMGDDSAARKKLAKIPAKGATPAYLYAQAALSFSRKDVATAQKTISTAQATYPAAQNDLFADSLETAGWQAPPPPLTSVFPSSLPAPGAAPYAGGGERPMQVDPRLEAAVADPLPAASGPVYSKVPAITTTPAERETKAAEGEKASPAKGSTPKSQPAGSPSPAASPVQDHTGLLLE